MSLFLDETPRLPSPSSPHRGATRLASCFAVSATMYPVQRAWKVSFLDNPGRTYPLGTYGPSLEALAMPPISLPAKQCRCCWRGQTIRLPREPT